MAPVFRIILIAAALYGIVLLGAYLLQARLLYFPDTRRVAPADAGLPGVREEILTASDGTALVTWRAPPAGPDKPTIVYFHGNGGNLTDRASYFQRFLAQGWGLAALSFRGYGGSGGRPAEAAIVADALAFYDTLIAEGVAEDHLIVFGESLGTGVAIQLCSRRQPRGIVLDAPYSRVIDVAAERYPFLLPWLLLRDRYPSLDHVAKINAPLLWLHGEADFIVPLRFGQRLFDAAPEPKTAAIVPRGGHNNLMSEEIFARVVVPFVDGLMRPAPHPRPPT